MDAGIEELFDQTLHGDCEDEAPWAAVSSLRRIGTREVFEHAVTWVQSDDPRKRTRGIDVLAQLGKTADHPSNNFPEESYAVVTTALQREQELQPLNSAVAALGHLDDPRAIPLIAAFHSHPSSEIRFSVTCALGCFPNDALSIETLRALLEDPDDDVRDWATFGLGVLGDHDSPEIRDALCGRLMDPDTDVREEAMAGLAKRQDARVVPSLIHALEQPEISGRVIETAYRLLGMDNDEERWSGRDYATALRERFQI
jgi:HEAT repeat protein